MADSTRACGSACGVLSFLTRTSLLLSFFFAADKVLAFGKTLLFNKIVGLAGMGIFGAANNIPDYLSALLSGGALGVALVPVLQGNNRP